MEAALTGHMISLDQIAIGYLKSVPLLKGVNLAADKGEMIALVGRNGTGKSTLLRSILGLIPFLEGECRLLNMPLQQFDQRIRAQTISYVSSKVASLPSINVRELVSLGRMPYTGWSGKLGREDEDMVQKAIREVGMASSMDRKLDQLSDGERQRVMIARALAQNTRVMVLDEPTAYLDIPNTYELVRLLSGFRDQGKTVLYSTHDLETAMMCADKFWVIDGGRVFEGSPEDLGMSGLFDRLFDSSGIAFDLETGRFGYRVKPRGGFQLTGDTDQALAWTRRAMERLGFEEKAGDASIRIEVKSGKTGVQWKLIQKQDETVCDSLHKLARLLTQNI